jgi:hypothetical protein
VPVCESRFLVGRVCFESKRFGYESGSYSAGVKEIKGNQTIAIDFRQLRDNQTPDTLGRVIPLNVERGQISWSVNGDANKTLSGRSEQVSLSQGISTTYDCRNCCPDTFYDAANVPGTATTFPFDTTQFIATQRDINCYGVISAPFSLSPFDWISFNTGIATVDGNGFATAEDTGSTVIQAHWGVYTWTYLPVNDSCQANYQDVLADSPYEVRPRIKSLTPERSLIGRTVNVTIEGDGFATGSTIQISGSDVTISNVSVVSSKKITADFSVASNGTVGDRQVTVTVNGQISNSKDFRVQVPYELEVISDTGNAALAACPSVIARVITYKINDGGHKEIRQPVNILEALDNLTTNTCGNGQPNPSSCAATTSSGSQYYQFSDNISVTNVVNGMCSTIAVNTCSQNPSCGYEYTQKWKTCTTDGNIQLMSAAGITHCNEIRINNSLQFTPGTRLPR